MNPIAELNEYRSKYSSNLGRGISVATKLAAAYVTRKESINTGPLYVGWDITYRCNAKCVYCDRWSDREMIPKELSKEQALQVVNDLADLKIWLLSIGGGEPFLRSDMMNIIKLAKKRGLCLNINTNGMFLKKHAQELVDLGVDAITLSAEGVTAEVHDTIRNTPNLYKGLMEGIEEVKKLRGSSKIPSVKIRTVVNKGQYEHLDEYVQFWQGVVDEVVLQPIHNFELHQLRVPKEMEFSPEDKKEFEEVFGALQKKYKFLTKNYYQEFKDFFFNTQAVKEKYRCFAGYYMMHLNPDGKVYPCTTCIKYLGNLHEISFKEIWRGVEAKNFRKIIRNNENKCFCWYYCSGTFSSALQPVLGKFK